MVGKKSLKLGMNVCQPSKEDYSYCEKAYQITNAKAYVFSDSVLCVGKMGADTIATWKSKIKW